MGTAWVAGKALLVCVPYSSSFPPTAWPVSSTTTPAHAHTTAPHACLSLIFKALHDAAPALTHSPCVPATSGVPISRTSHCLLLHRTDGDSNRGPAPALDGPQEPAGEAHQAPEAAPREQEIVPSGPEAPDVFETLQHVLSSLEAAAGAWRCQPLSCPGPMEVEGRIEGEPRLFLEQEGAGGFQREAAHLAERNAWLRLALGSRENELMHLQASLEAVQEEKETLQREVSGASLPPRACCLREQAAWPRQCSVTCSFEKLMQH